MKDKDLITVSIKIEGCYRKNDIEIELDVHSTLDKLLQILISHKDLCKYIVNKDKSKMMVYGLFINKEFYGIKDSYSKILKDGDKLLFISSISGG